MGRTVNRWKPEDPIMTEVSTIPAGEVARELDALRQYSKTYPEKDIRLTGEGLRMLLAEIDRRDVAPAGPAGPAQIQHMVERFLAWKLPDDFNPDGGVSFTPTFNDHLPTPMRHEPTGTNLLTYTQAEGMVRHMLEGLEPASTMTIDQRIDAAAQVVFADDYDLDDFGVAAARAILIAGFPEYFPIEERDGPSASPPEQPGGTGAAAGDAVSAPAATEERTRGWDF